MRYKKCLEKIKDNAYRFNLKAEYVSCYTLKLYSEKYMFDSWLVELTDFGLELKHMNKFIYSHKLTYHTQRIVAKHKWWWILETIRSHNEYVINKKRSYRCNEIDRVLKDYNESRKSVNGNKRI